MYCADGPTKPAAIHSMDTVKVNLNTVLFNLSTLYIILTVTCDKYQCIINYKSKSKFNLQRNNQKIVYKYTRP